MNQGQETDTEEAGLLTLKGRKLTFREDDVVIALVGATGTHKESLAQHLFFLHNTLWRSRIFENDSVVGVLGVMAKRLQCYVLIILSPRVQRFMAGERREKKENGEIRPPGQKSNLNSFPSQSCSNNGSWFLFCHVNRLSFSLLCFFYSFRFFHCVFSKPMYECKHEGFPWGLSGWRTLHITS